MKHAPRPKSLWILTFAMLCAAGIANAAPIDITGRVVDWLRNPVPNHPVSISGPGIPGSYIMYTASTGVFRYTDAPEQGTYIYTISVGSATRTVTVEWGTPVSTGDWVLPRPKCKIPCEFSPEGDDDMPNFDSELPPNPLWLHIVGRNPFRSEVRLRATGSANGAILGGQVLDVRGRLVRGIAPAFSGNVVWDGRDQAGARVAPGVYFIRVSNGRSIATARVVMIP